MFQILYMLFHAALHFGQIHKVVITLFSSSYKQYQ